MKIEKENIAHRSHCAINMALEAIGDKWSLLILRDLMFTKKRSYGELQASEEKIATNILASRLNMLEANGIIYKSPDPNNGRRHLYFLTEKGIDLLPVVIELWQWMEKYSDDTSRCPNQVQFTNENRQQKLADYTFQLKAAHHSR